MGNRNFGSTFAQGGISCDDAAPIASTGAASPTEGFLKQVHTLIRFRALFLEINLQMGRA
jgi:hypothetical protein